MENKIEPNIVSLADAREQGLKFYFTGKPCKRGHICERYVSIRVCVKCHGDAFQEWRKANPEKRRNNLDDWKKRNKDKHNRYVKNAKAKNPELYNAFSTSWKKRNPEKRKQVVAEYAQRNVAKIRSAHRIYETKKVNACPAWVSREELQEIYARCRQITIDTGIQHHVDHIVPLRNKRVCGLHVPWNLRIVPAQENLSKGNKLIEEIL